MNYEASLDVVVNSRAVYNMVKYVSEIGGFLSFALLLTLGSITFWNNISFDFFLIEKIFLKKEAKSVMTKITLALTSLSKQINRDDFIIRLKGKQRIDKQTDIVKLIRKFFILDQIIKRLISPITRAASIKKGKFIIDPATLVDQKVTSEDSDVDDPRNIEQSQFKNDESNLQMVDL